MAATRVRRAANTPSFMKPSYYRTHGVRLDANESTFPDAVFRARPRNTTREESRYPVWSQLNRGVLGLGAYGHKSVVRRPFEMRG